MIDFTLTEEQEKTYQDIASFANKELNDNIIERDKDQKFSLNEWKKCGKLKIQGLCVAKEYGGLGFNAVSTAIALEALGYGSMDGGLNFSIAAHLLAVVLPISIYGNEEQKKIYLPKLCNGTLISANAMTEAESGSDVFRMKTFALKKEDEYIINGTKIYISNAPVADIILAYASTNAEKGFHGGISAFIIDNDIDGQSRSTPYTKMGLHTCQMGNIAFQNMAVSNKTLLGKEGAGAIIFSESMNWERALMSAIHVGTMQRILEECLTFSKSRNINNEPISKFQSISHQLAEMSIKIESSRLMVYHAANQIDKKSIKASMISSSSKVFVSETFNEVCSIAQNIFGAAGYIADNHIERMVRDAAAAKIYSGTNNIQKNIISSWLGV